MSTETQPKKIQQSAREDRVAAALRQNLLRRKQQQAARQQGVAADTLNTTGDKECP